MDDATLASLEHENMTAAGTLAFGQVPGALVRHVDGVVQVATGLAARLFNQVAVERDDASPDAIADAVSLARRRGDHFVVNLRAGEDDRLLPVIGSLGLVPLAGNPWMPGMALHPLPHAGGTAPEAGHEIRRVTDGAGIRDHIETAAAGFGMPIEWLELIVTGDLARHPDASLYVGYTDGVPVTTGLGVRTGRTIGVYNVATIETARRRGYGAAMTMRIVEDGAADGCDVAILQASDMGRPVYERLGFRTVVEYMGYVDPASLPPGEPA